MRIIQVKGIEKDFVINLDKICYIEIRIDEVNIVFEHNWVAFGTDRQSSTNWNKISDSELTGLKKNIAINSPYWINRKC